jgi:hypothetical protein
VVSLFAGRSGGKRDNDNTAQKKNFFFALVFTPLPGVIWGADSENDIG